MVLNLNDAIQACWKRIDEGQVATYIPALAKVDPYQLGVCLYDVDSGKKNCAGASEVRFDAILCGNCYGTLAFPFRLWNNGTSCSVHGSGIFASERRLGRCLGT